MECGLHLLDSETRSRIRSTQILTSLPQIVSELVQNSLDANASNVHVGVDVSEWECCIRDDGSGISKKDMSILAKGPVDGRYASSKAYEIGSLDQVSTFGFRGEALASAADICCLEISSRTKAASESWSVIVKGGKTLHYGPAIRWRRETAGTVVSVRDAFYNRCKKLINQQLPVRRKTHPSTGKSLESIKRDLYAFSLVFPHVSFTLEDTSKSPHLNRDRSKILSISKTSSSLEAFRSAFGRALVENVHSVQNQANGAVLEGFISLEGAPSKAYQFFYINNRLLDPCLLHYVIDSAFARSTFGKNAFADDGPTTVRQTSRRSPRKDEKRPVYVLKLTLPGNTVDSLLDPSKRSVYLSDVGLVQYLILSSVKEFLAQHNFVSPARTGAIEEEESDEFAEDSSLSINIPSRDIQFLAIRPSDRCSKQIRSEQEANASVQAEGQYIAEWEDSQTSEIFPANNGTGHSGLDMASIVEPVPLVRNFGSIDKSSLRNGPPTTTDEQPDWIKGILTDWGDPIYRTGEGRSGVDGIAGFVKGSSKENAAEGMNQGKRSAMVFTANDLENAEVLGQVDRKFIACAVHRHSQDEDVLILVDQHAADERVRVERFLQEYCEGAMSFEDSRGDGSMEMDGVELTRLDPCALVLLSKREADLAYTAEVRNYLSRWGIELDDRPILQAPESRDEERVQISISAVPGLIETKGNELQNVLKSILGEVDVHGAPVWHSEGVGESVEGAPRWLRAWRECPGSLLALINSKACRGAIMFNDPLSLEQCSRLVLQLSQSILPFQCAHGRPSIAPLVPLDCLGRLPLKRDLGTRASARKIDWLKFQHRYL